MDILDIRKKAKEKKKAAEKDGSEKPVQKKDQPAGEDRPSKAGKKSGRTRGKKAAGKGPGKGAGKAVHASKAAAAMPEPEVPGGTAAEGPARPEDRVEETTAPGIVAKTAAEMAARPGADAAAGPEVHGPEAGKEGKEAAAEGEEAAWADEAAEEEAVDRDVVEYLAFRLAKEEYAVKVDDVKEIIRLQKMTVVPRAPGFVDGIISLRGVVVPVFDIRKRLGLDLAEKGRTTRIVVVSEGGQPQGMLVDKVTGVVKLKAAGIEPPPAVIGGVEADYLEGVGRVDGRLLILFNTEKVLSLGDLT